MDDPAAGGPHHSPRHGRNKSTPVRFNSGGRGARLEYKRVADGSASRDTVFGAPASPGFPLPSPPAVMAGLVPAIHVLLHRGARPEGTRR